MDVAPFKVYQQTCHISWQKTVKSSNLLAGDENCVKVTGNQQVT